MRPLGKQEIIQKFLQYGYQLDEESLDYFSGNGDKIEETIKKLVMKGEKSSTITMETVKELGYKKTEHTVTITSNPVIIPRPYTINHYINYISQRYDVIRNLLRLRTELPSLTSINKTPKLDAFSLAAIIREKNEGGELTVEDPTGEIKIYLEDAATENFRYLVNDEVIGLVCQKTGERILAQKVIFPDIPIKKEITKTEGDTHCLFFQCTKDARDTTDKVKNTIKNIDESNLIIFIAKTLDGELIQECEKNLPQKAQKFIMLGYENETSDSLISPTIVDIGGVRILLLSGSTLNKYTGIFKCPQEETITNLLKKRHMNPTISLGTIYQKDPFLLDIVPDILVIFGFGKELNFNYRGVTVLSTGTPDRNVAWLVDLKNRETIKIDLS